MCQSPVFANARRMDRVHLFCRFPCTEYVDDRASVGAHGGARALATDFSAHLLVRGLDKLCFFMQYFVYSVSMIITVVMITEIMIMACREIVQPLYTE